MTVDYLPLYEAVGVAAASGITELAFEAACPLCAAAAPALQVARLEGRFRCRAPGCFQSGTFLAFQTALEAIGARAPRSVSPASVDERHKLLLEDPFFKFAVTERLGMQIGTIEKYRLGWENGRLVIPIADAQGIMDLRRIAVAEVAPGARILSLGAGYAAARLWPRESLGGEGELWVAHDELDCLHLLQLGLVAVTATTATGAWLPAWASAAAGKRVRICYPATSTGKAAAQALGALLGPLAVEVRTLELKLDEGSTICDAVVWNHWDRARFVQLALEAPVLRPPTPAEDPTVHEVELHEAGASSLVGKKVKVRVVVAGKDLAPYSAPKEIQLTCKALGAFRFCAACPIKWQDNNLKHTIASDDVALLKLIQVTEAQQRKVIAKTAGIPDKCDRFDLAVNAYQNLEELKLLPDVDKMPDTAREYVIRTGYYVGDGTKTNQAYVAEGRSVPDPRTQYVTMLLPKLTAVQSSVEGYVPTEASLERLRFFQPRAQQEPMERWKDLVVDLEANVTRIHQRPGYIFATDLVMHSMLAFDFQGTKLTRGWVDGLIVGDTRCGKSDSVQRLLRHYGAGEFITGENVSYAGLVGGVQQTQKRWSITWGKLPLLDGRMAALDEVSGLQPEIIEALSGIRSSGMAEITKIQNERTRARVRQLWIGNPRSARALDTYSSGAQVIRELIGRPEDIARFDFGMLVASADVPLSVVNGSEASQVAYPHRATADLCHELIMWAWSRKREQVTFDDVAVKAILGHAENMSKKYGGDLPLVEPNEQRIKLARLSAACAARLFSTDDGVTLRVKAEHVDAIVELLTRWYEHASFDYSQASETRRGELNLSKVDEGCLRSWLENMGPSALRAILGIPALNFQDLEDITTWDRVQVTKFKSALVRYSGVRRKTAGYVKTPGFIRLLREIIAEGRPEQADLNLTK